MNRWLTFGLVGLLVMGFFGCAGSSKYMMAQTTPPPEGPSPGKALIYFMRPSGIGFAIHFQIYHNQELIGLSQAKSYFAYECDPGKQLFLCVAENKRGLEADLEAGKTYYALTQVRMGAWKARMAFIPVTQGSEFWDKVIAYKANLNFVAADKAELNAYRQAHKDKIDAVLVDTYAFLKTPKGKEYIVYLNKEDGR